MSNSGYPKNFTRGELIHSDFAKKHRINNTPQTLEIEANLILLADWLQGLRDKIQKVTGKEYAVKVTSGYRCPILNSRLGGSKTSAHLIGSAADFVVSGMSTEQLAAFIAKYMPASSWDQVIEEDGRWVHVGLQRCGGSEPRGQILHMRKEEVDGEVRRVYKIGLE